MAELSLNCEVIAHVNIKSDKSWSRVAFSHAVGWRGCCGGLVGGRGGV